MYHRVMRLLPCLAVVAAVGCVGEAGEAPDEQNASADLAGNHEIRDGMVYYEGDMLLGTVAEVFGGGGDLSERSAGVFNVTEGYVSGTPWTDGLIRWRWEPGFDLGSTTRDQDWLDAVKHWTDNTTMRFQQLTGTPAGNYVTVNMSDTSSAGCSAPLGMQTGERTVKIGRASCTFGSIVHEIGHVVGLVHEHTRPNRDSFVIVGETGSNWDINNNVSEVSDYEIQSIMHYGSSQGSVTDLAGNPIVQNRTALTYRDIQGAQIIYGDQFSPFGSVDHRTVAGRKDFFYRTATGTVGHRYLQGSTWTNGSDRGSPNNAGIYGSPISVSRDGTSIDLVVLGSDERIYHRAYNGSAWTNWAAVGTNTFRGQPVGVSRQTDRFNVYVRAADGALWSNYYNGTSWSSWSSLGGFVVGTPAVVSIDSNHIDIFALHANHTLRRLSWNNVSSWGSWQSTGSGTLRGHPVAIKRGTDNIRLFVKTTNGRIQHRTYYPLTATYAASWANLNDFAIIGNPSVAVGIAGGITVAVAGSDRQLRQASFHATNPGVISFGQLGSTLVGSPATMDDVGNDKFHVLSRGTDDAIWRRTYTDGLPVGTWSAWSLVGGSTDW